MQWNCVLVINRDNLPAFHMSSVTHLVFMISHIYVDMVYLSCFQCAMPCLLHSSSLPHYHGSRLSMRPCSVQKYIYDLTSRLISAVLRRFTNTNGKKDRIKLELDIPRQLQSCDWAAILESARRTLNMRTFHGLRPFL